MYWEFNKPIILFLTILYILIIHELYSNIYQESYIIYISLFILFNFDRTCYILISLLHSIIFIWPLIPTYIHSSFPLPSIFIFIFFETWNILLLYFYVCCFSESFHPLHKVQNKISNNFALSPSNCFECPSSFINYSISYFKLTLCFPLKFSSFILAFLLILCFANSIFNSKLILFSYTFWIFIIICQNLGDCKFNCSSFGVYSVVSWGSSFKQSVIMFIHFDQLLWFQFQYVCDLSPYSPPRLYYY